MDPYWPLVAYELWTGIQCVWNSDVRHKNNQMNSSIGNDTINRSQKYTKIMIFFVFIDLDFITNGSIIEPLNKNKKNVNYYLTMNIYGEARDITNKNWGRQWCRLRNKRTEVITLWLKILIDFEKQESVLFIVSVSSLRLFSLLREKKIYIMKICKYLNC